MPATGAGGFRQKVILWQNVPTVASDGQKVEVATEVCQRWCEVLPMSGRERFYAQQTQADITHRVRTWSDALTRTITPKMWFTLSDGTRLDITRAFDEDLRRKVVVIECNQRV